ncbi:MAG TPA: hypothetical protein VGJ32_13320, partial [Solirubrobacteraceae bacterium]
APATAAAPTIRFSLKGAYAVKVMRGCGEKSTHHYAHFRSGLRISFSGRISPAPRRGFRVKIKLKRCVGGKDFRTLRETSVRGGSRGRFSGGVASPGRGIYWLRAYYGGKSSKKEQLRVT